MNGREAPIGVFDSGFGGLTVMRSLVDQLPNEDFVYLGDTARAPYGPRPIAQVREFAIQGLDHLAGRGASLYSNGLDSAVCGRPAKDMPSKVSQAVWRKERYKMPRNPDIPINAFC